MTRTYIMVMLIMIAIISNTVFSESQNPGFDVLTIIRS